MKLKKIFAAIFGSAKAGRVSVGRHRVTDIAFTYRMGAGFPGDVSRTHPASIEPAVNNATNPILRPGDLCLADTATNTVRSLLATDTAITTVYGFAVRSYPIGPSTAGAYGAADFGTANLPSGQPVDILRSGYILGSLNTGTATKGGQVFVWVAETSGVHIQGGLETVASAGNTCALDITEYQFNGPADANGVVEVSVRI